MSHCSTQIVDWVQTSLSAVGGLPSPVIGTPRQIASGLEAVVITLKEEAVTPSTIHDPVLDQRQLTVSVMCISADFVTVDELSVLVEEGLANAASFPGEDLILVSRSYDENLETDRDYCSVELTYTALYFVTRNNVETFE